MTLQDAIRKAKYGHKEWIFWSDKGGNAHFARQTADSVKAALMATGTQGTWTIIAASTRHLHKATWHMGITIVAGLKRGLMM